MCDPGFAESAQRCRIPALLGGTALVLSFVLTAGFHESMPDPSAQRAGMVILRVAGTWLIFMGALGFGKRYLSRASRALRYLAEGSYPVYILHQTVIVILAYYVVSLAVPTTTAQALILFALAVPGVFVLYEIVRRVGVLRSRTHPTPRGLLNMGAPSTGSLTPIIVRDDRCVVGLM